MRKPVKKVSVMMCLVLIAAIVVTLFVPVISINISPHGIKGEYTNITGLEIIKALFGDGGNFLAETTGVQTLYNFLGKGVADLTQYINPVFVNIMLWTYIVCLAVSGAMLIFTMFNFAGRRLSVFNVLSGLVVFICGIIICLCIPLQNAEYVTNSVIFYNLRLSFGAIMVIVSGFFYMMVAPKKRI